MNEASNIANQLWNDLLSLIFPETCLSCQRTLMTGEDYLCTFCRHQLPVQPVVDQFNPILADKFVYEPRICLVVSYLSFKKYGMTQKLLHQLKYRNAPEIGELLGRWFGEALKDNEFAMTFDALLPVPLHSRKRKIRGYNQSEEIAKGMSASMGLPYNADILMRTRHTATQTRKRKVERWQNVSAIFKVNDEMPVAGKRFLLVDDVLTTGATLSSCAEALLEQGAKAIGICTLGFAAK